MSHSELPKEGATPDEEIARHRAAIDAADREIAQLLHKRAEAAKAIGHHKSESGAPFYDASRQKEVVRRVVEESGDGPFPAGGFRAVFNEIMSACLGLERPLRVGYLGPPGTFSHVASRNEFGSAPELVPYRSFADLFDAAAREGLDYAMVPIENSANGMVHFVIDLLMEHELTIAGETIIPIHHCLLSNAKMEEIETVYSHPQGLQQCVRWLQRNLPDADPVEVGSTVIGVERALKDKKGAAIGSRLAAELNGIDILRPNIEDMTQNVTRFLTVGKSPSRRSEHDKTSLMFSVPDRPGALYHILGYFDSAKINLTKIENRPSRRKLWDYVFFVDLLGHHEEPHIAGVIEQLRSECSFFKMLGSYPRDVSTAMPNGAMPNGGGSGDHLNVVQTD